METRNGITRMEPTYFKIEENTIKTISQEKVHKEYKVVDNYHNGSEQKTTEETNRKAEEAIRKYEEQREKQKVDENKEKTKTQKNEIEPEDKEENFNYNYIMTDLEKDMTTGRAKTKMRQIKKVMIAKQPKHRKT